MIRNAIKNGGLENIDAIRDAIESTGAIEYTARLAEEEASKAISNLHVLESSVYVDSLDALARFAVERKF